MRKLTIPLSITALILMSCQTMPMEPFPDAVDWIPSESNIVLRFVAYGNEYLAETLVNLVGLEHDTVKPILARTAMFAAGLEIGGEWNSFSGIPIHAVAVGLWPRGILGSVLGKNWKRSHSDRYLWSGPDGLELTLPTKQEILLSRGRLDSLASSRLGSVSNADRWHKLPQDVDLAILVSGATTVAQLIPLATGWIDSLSVSVNKDETHRYKVNLIFYPTEEHLTPSLMLALRLALSSWLGRSAIPEERELLSKINVEAIGGKIFLTFPPVELSLLNSMVSTLNLFTEKNE